MYWIFSMLCDCCKKHDDAADLEEQKYELQLDDSESAASYPDRLQMQHARNTLMRIVADVENDASEASSGYPNWYFADVDDKILKRQRCEEHA